MIDNRGVSCLGVNHPKYPIGKLVKVFRNASVVRFTWLDLFFNAKDSKNAVRLMKIPKPKIAVVHIINGPGMNNNRTQKHEITYRETTESVVRKVLENDSHFLNKFRARVRMIGDIAFSAPPGTLRLIVSPWLEHKPIPKACFDKLANEIRDYLGPVEILDNPLPPTPAFNGPGYLSSKHGDQAPKTVDIADLDGLDWEGTDLVKYAKRHESAVACFIWGGGENGLKYMKPGDPWLPPEKRTKFTWDREWPMYANFIRDGGMDINSPLNPVDTEGLELIDPDDEDRKDFVWKLGEGKNYATVLFPKRFQTPFSKVVIKKNGKVFDKAKYRGKYNDGTNRMIYDFTKHLSKFPDNCVLVADDIGFVLEKACFRID